MGVYKTTVIDADASQKIANLVAYLNDLDGITAIEGSIDIDSVTYNGAAFSFDDSSIGGFFGINDQGTFSAVSLQNGSVSLVEPIAAGAAASNPGDISIHSYIDDDCKILSIRDCTSTHNGIEIAIVNVSNSNTLVGYKVNTSNPVQQFVDISELTFENVSDSARIQYSYTNMFPYESNPGTLDFLAQSYFVNNGVRVYMSNVLKECSTLSLLTTASLPYPLGNHIAVGAHCVVPITVEEGGNE